MKNIKVRLGVLEDEKYLIKWLKDKDVLRWFPMDNEVEILDASKLWISYALKKALLTVTCEGVPCGIANLYVQSYEKLKHQCLFAVIVSPDMRGQGVGTLLLNELFKLAKESFGIEIIHLEVYEGNPAMRLYERLGFKVFGFQRNFLKESNGSYRGKYFMQKILSTN